MRNKNIKLTIFILIFLIATSILFYLSWGSYKISPSNLLKTFLGKGLKLQKTVLFDIRLPRMFVGISVGIALSTAGALLQTLTRNELAESGIIGINAGAAVAAVIFISLKTVNYYNELGEFSIYVLPLMAIFGAGISAFFLYLLSCKGGMKPKRLLLVGLGVNSGLNAFIIFFTFRGGVSDYNRVLVWTSGSLWGADVNYAKIIIPVVFVMFLIVLLNHRKLDILNFTDEHAISLGLNINKERKKLLTYAVILAGSATAFAGNVGFIGLICPHMARKLVGPYHRYYLVVSASISIIILLIADAVSRNLFSPIELPVGITISIFGVPYFIYLMSKEK